MRILLSVGIFSAAALVLGANVVFAQNYPNKPVRIVTVEPGGSGDFAARLIAQAITGSLGQPVIVENRGGGNGVIAIARVAKALPDGYTVLIYNNGMWILPLLQKVPYEPISDFSPITLSLTSPNILVVHPSLAVNSVKELIAVAKAKPGELSYGSSGTGNTTHLAGELFNAMAGVKLVHVPYKGGGPALTDLVGGQVHLMFATATSVAPHTQAGKLRALAVTSAQPSALLPGMPTVAASGVPGFESASIQGLFAPAGTPAALINRLNAEIVRALKTADVKERFLKTGSEIVGSTPEQLAATIKADMARMSKVIKDAGIHAD